MIHVGDISAEKRINAPAEVLKTGQVVKALVLECDIEKRRLRLGMKQLVPTSLDEYIAEHKEGDVVTGRTIDASGARARVELGEGIQARCRMDAAGSAAGKSAQGKPDASSSNISSKASAKPDLSSLGSMLQARWKSGAPAGEAKPEAVRAGQILKFRIVKVDAATKKIELELASQSS
jgi:small subunit ribosomal protein S1